MTLDRKRILKDVRDYMMVTVGMLSYCIGWTLFLLPNTITTGGVPGIASVVFWGTGIPVTVTYTVINIILLLIALKVLGWQFCAKTIYGVFVLSTATSLATAFFANTHLLHDQPFMAAIIGAIFCGSGVGLGLASGGSSGGTDIVAAIVHKYRDISLGRVIMMIDIIIITSSYLVLHSWEKVIYGYVVLWVTAFCVDQVVGAFNQSVQFFIISKKYREIADRIAVYPRRGATVIEAKGYHTGDEVHMLFIMAKKRESAVIFHIINEIDPAAFVTQSNVKGVYGNGFDRIKGKRKNGPTLPSREGGLTE